MAATTSRSDAHPRAAAPVAARLCWCPMSLPASTSSEIRSLIEQHRAARPDHLACLHPLATREMRATFTCWSNEMERLKTLLGMALAAEAHGWRDAAGSPVAPTEWAGHADIHNLKTLAEKHQRKGGPGRPRSENPSQEALRCRERRAKKREVA